MFRKGRKNAEPPSHKEAWSNSSEMYSLIYLTSIDLKKSKEEVFIKREMIKGHQTRRLKTSLVISKILSLSYVKCSRKLLVNIGRKCMQDRLKGKFILHYKYKRLKLYKFINCKMMNVDLILVLEE